MKQQKLSFGKAKSVEPIQCINPCVHLSVTSLMGCSKCFTHKNLKKICGLNEYAIRGTKEDLLNRLDKCGSVFRVTDNLTHY